MLRASVRDGCGRPCCSGCRRRGRAHRPDCSVSPWVARRPELGTARWEPQPGRRVTAQGSAAKREGRELDLPNEGRSWFPSGELGLWLAAGAVWPGRGCWTLCRPPHAKAWGLRGQSAGQLAQCSTCLNSHSLTHATSICAVPLVTQCCPGARAEKGHKSLPSGAGSLRQQVRQQIITNALAVCQPLISVLSCFIFTTLCCLLF